MNNWERVKFLDVCDIQGGTQPPKKEWSSEKKDGYIRMLQIRDFTQDKEKYIEYVKDKSTLKKCRKDDILIGRYGASVGKVLIGLEGAYNVAIVKTIPDENILDKNYLYYFLIAPTFQGYIKNAGTRAAQSGFNKSDLENLFLPLPPLSMQKEIVERLDKADALRQKDQELVAQYDHLAQALFIDLFGDPVANEKGWETDLLNDVAPIERFEEKIKPDEKGLFWLLNLDMIESHTGKIIEKKMVLEREINSSTFKFSEKNVLYSKLRPYLNKVVIPKERGYCTTELVPLCPKKEKINRFFLGNLLRSKSFVEYIEEKVAGAKMPRVNMDILRNFLIILPPISLQNQFAEMIENIEAQKAKAKKQAEESENLFQALLQEAFSV